MSWINLRDKWIGPALVLSLLVNVVAISELLSYRAGEAEPVSEPAPAYVPSAFAAREQARQREETEWRADRYERAAREERQARERAETESHHAQIELLNERRERIEAERSALTGTSMPLGARW